MYRIDDENEHLNIDDNLGAEVAMDACMGAIHDLLLDPMMAKDELSEEDGVLFAVIGQTLKTIALKAQAYEDVYEKGILPKNSQN
jgi:hypothetical protein